MSSWNLSGVKSREASLTTWSTILLGRKCAPDNLMRNIERKSFLFANSGHKDLKAEDWCARTGQTTVSIAVPGTVM